LTPISFVFRRRSSTEAALSVPKRGALLELSWPGRELGRGAFDEPNGPYFVKIKLAKPLTNQQNYVIMVLLVFGATAYTAGRLQSVLYQRRQPGVHSTLIRTAGRISFFQ